MSRSYMQKQKKKSKIYMRERESRTKRDIQIADLYYRK